MTQTAAALIHDGSAAVPGVRIYPTNLPMGGSTSRPVAKATCPEAPE
jgi:hypothetical protein